METVDYAEFRRQRPEGSPFGGIPRNWKRLYFVPQMFSSLLVVPPSGGSLEIGNLRPDSRPRPCRPCSPFGGIPRNWKLEVGPGHIIIWIVPPSGGSLEIGNTMQSRMNCMAFKVPPSGGSLEIGNGEGDDGAEQFAKFPLRGDP